MFKFKTIRPVSQDVRTLLEYLDNLKYEMEQQLGSVNALLWLEPKLLEDCTNYGGGYYDLAYTKISVSQVFFRGLINVSAGDADRILFYVKPEFRPKKTITIAVTASDSLARIRIYANGAVQIATAFASQFWLTFDGVTYIAEQ